jgi:hypothetical protein
MKRVCPVCTHYFETYDKVNGKRGSVTGKRRRNSTTCSKNCSKIYGRVYKCVHDKVKSRIEKRMKQKNDNQK